MRITVNLASRPYVELRPLYSRLRLWVIVFAAVGIVLGLLLRADRQSVQASLAQVASLNHDIAQLEQRQQSYQQLMQQPENAATLRQSRFLNDLFKRKAFSWTATVEDLETVLPSGVEVEDLEPVMLPNGQVELRLRVLGPRNLGINLIRNLEGSKYFAQPHLVSESLAANNSNQSSAMQIDLHSYVNFDILANYRPLPTPVHTDKSMSAATMSGASATAKSSLPKSRRRRPRLHRASPKGIDGAYTRPSPAKPSPMTGAHKEVRP